MATKTATCGAGALIYQDKNGVEHTVTTSQTFTFERTDLGPSAVTYASDIGTSVTTTDGGRITFRPRTNMASNTSGATGSARRTWGPTADAQNNTAIYSLAGELVAEFSDCGIPQMWKSITLTVDDVDAPTTMDGTWEDQFGMRMVWTGITVA